MFVCASTCVCSARTALKTSSLCWRCTGPARLVRAWSMNSSSSQHGEVDVTYPLPSLEGCLKDTYSYRHQEQVSTDRADCAGYPRHGEPAPANDGKKTPAMAKNEPVDGAVKNASKEKGDGKSLT